MARQLCLLRHAKSDWSMTLADFERPLNHRGQQQSLQMGAWMQRNNLIPDCILSSPATRARETILNICSELTFDAQEIQWQEDLYHASRQTLLREALSRLEKYPTVMLVAHNPGLDDLLAYLSPADESTMYHMTTACFAQFELPDNLQELDDQKGHLLRLVRPADIE